MTKWKYCRLVLFAFGIWGLVWLVAEATIVDYDFRERGRSPVAIEVVTVTVDYDVNTTVGTATVTTNGNVEQIVITVPEMQDPTTTVDFKLKDENGVTIGESPDTNGESNFDTLTSRVWRPSDTVLIAGTTTVEITTNNAQTEDHDITVEMYLR